MSNDRQWLADLESTNTKFVTLEVPDLKGIMDAEYERGKGQLMLALDTLRVYAESGALQGNQMAKRTLELLGADRDQDRT